MHKLALSIAIVSLLATGCATVPQQNKSEFTSSDEINIDILPLYSPNEKNLLTGKWYRKQPTKSGETSEEFCVMHGNGRYESTFRTTYPNGEIESYTESGLWGISGGIHFTISLGAVFEDGYTMRADPEDPATYNAYRVLELDEEKFRYQGAVTGNIFTLFRAEDDFELSK